MTWTATSLRSMEIPTPPCESQNTFCYTLVPDHTCCHQGLCAKIKSIKMYVSIQCSPNCVSPPGFSKCWIHAATCTGWSPKHLLGVGKESFQEIRIMWKCISMHLIDPLKAPAPSAQLWSLGTSFFTSCNPIDFSGHLVPVYSLRSRF